MKTVETNASVEETTRVEKEIITAKGVMAPLEGVKGHVRLELSPVKRAGVWLAGWVLVLISVVSLALVGGWIATTIRAPSQCGIVLDGSVKMFEAVVPRLLPILTLLIGYLFGRGEQSRED